jgi:radical SAM protein with 4Fe4S-binding SPASM domain
MRKTLPKIIKNLFLKQPSFTVIFLTQKCNLDCKMCFNPKDKECNELSCNELHRLAKTLPPQWYIMFTGGEPFLRNDIEEIAGYFYHRGAINIHFSTNGILTDVITERIKNIALQAKQSRIIVTVSIDGPKEVHDHIRGIDGAFEKAIATIKELTKLNKNIPNLDIGINYTFSSYNEHCWKETFDFIINTLHISNINIGLTRGNTRKKKAIEFNIHNYIQAQNYLYSANSQKPLSMLNKLSRIKNTIQSNIIYKIAQSQPTPFYDCLACKTFSVITETGDVYPCELLNKSIGNLRNVDMDFMKLWESGTANNIRKHIKNTKCRCTYECAMTATLASSFSTIKHLALLTLKQK